MLRRDVDFFRAEVRPGEVFEEVGDAGMWEVEGSAGGVARLRNS